MRRILLSVIATAAAVGFTASVEAADLPVKAPAPMAYPVLNNWSGWYVGLNAGYSWGRSSIDYAQGPSDFFGIATPGDVLALSTNLSPQSFIGGGQIGFNYQTGQWVWGLETDFAWRDHSDSVSLVLNNVSDALTLTDNQRWVGTVRGRLGMAPQAASNWLFYVTGGLAYGNFEHSVTQFCNVGCGQTQTFSNSVTRAGWTIGGGVEVALDRNWSLGAEYLYMDFGKDTLSAAAAGVPPLPVPGATTFPATTVSFHDTSNVARLKLNYRFGDLH
jgi:outer membrane immunogenic protein